MSPTAPPLHDDSVVPLARFGAALHRARIGASESLAGIARLSEGRFLPDQLVAIERGDVALDDDAIEALVGPYGLAERGWPANSTLELVLDRVEMSGIGATVSAPDVSPTWLATRCMALSVLLGLDVTSGPIGLRAFADAVELPHDSAIDVLGDVLANHAASIGETIERLEGRTVVPEVGFLVGATSTGSLVLARRGTTGVDLGGATVPPAGRLGDLLDRTR